MRLQNLLLCTLVEYVVFAIAGTDVAAIEVMVGTLTGTGTITLRPKQASPPVSLVATSSDVFTSDTPPFSAKSLINTSDTTQTTALFDATTVTKNQITVTETVLVKSTNLVTILKAPAWYPNSTLTPTYAWKQSVQVKATGALAQPSNAPSSNISLTAINSSARPLITPTATLDSAFFSRGSWKFEVPWAILAFATAAALQFNSC